MGQAGFARITRIDRWGMCSTTAATVAGRACSGSSLVARFAGIRRTTASDLFQPSPVRRRRLQLLRMVQKKLPVILRRSVVRREYAEKNEHLFARDIGRCITRVSKVITLLADPVEHGGKVTSSDSGRDFRCARIIPSVLSNRHRILRPMEIESSAAENCRCSPGSCNAPNNASQTSRNTRSEATPSITAAAIGVPRRKH